MITACGYTSKFNQATLGTSSRGAVAAAASACWGPWGSSQAAGLNPKSLLVWLHGPWHTWKPDWNQLGGVCTSCSHSEARGEEDQAPCSLHPHHTGDMRGQPGSCPGHPVRRPALLKLWNAAHIHLLSAGMDVLRLRAAQCQQGTSSQQSNTVNQDAESQTGFKTPAVPEARAVLGFIVRL